MMVLHFGIKDEDAQRQPDKTCARLFDLIGQNCHRIVVDSSMAGKYVSRLNQFLPHPQYQTRVLLFLASVIHNSQKFVVETSAPPEIPAAVAPAIPKEDHYVVRAALTSHPIIVTDEEKLTNRINANVGTLGLRAISPSEALELAKDF